MKSVLLDALIDLSQSGHDETAFRARAALFDAGVIRDGSDGGVNECRKLYLEKFEAETIDLT